jgi:hypothetical protein
MSDQASVSTLIRVITIALHGAGIIITTTGIAAIGSVRKRPSTFTAFNEPRLEP